MNKELELLIIGMEIDRILLGLLIDMEINQISLNLLVKMEMENILKEVKKL